MLRNRNLVKRIIIYVIGLFLYSLGIAITAKSDLGIAPVSTLPYALSFILPVSFGITTFFMTVVYILIQKVILGKNFEKKEYFQIVVGILFSSFIDLAMLVLRDLNPLNYVNRLITLFIGCFILAIGIVLSVVPDVITPPAEGAITVLARKFNKEFGTMKILVDGTIVVLAVIVSLLFLGRLEGFKEGTIISIFLTGIYTKILFKILGGRVEKLINK